MTSKDDQLIEAGMLSAFLEEGDEAIVFEPFFDQSVALRNFDYYAG